MTKFTFYCEFHIIPGDAIGQIEKWVRDEPGAHVHFISACLACVAVKKESRFIQFWNWNDKVYILLRIPYNFRWCDWTNTKSGSETNPEPMSILFLLALPVWVKKESRFIQFWNWNDKVYILLRIPYNFRWCDWANRKVGQRRTRSPCPFYFACLACVQLKRIKIHSVLKLEWQSLHFIANSV